MMKNFRCLYKMLSLPTLCLPFMVCGATNKSPSLNYANPDFNNEKRGKIDFLMFSPKSSVSNGTPLLSTASGYPSPKMKPLDLDRRRQSVIASQDMLDGIFNEYKQEIAQKEKKMNQVAACQTGIIICLIGSSYYHRRQRSSNQKGQHNEASNEV